MASLPQRRLTTEEGLAVLQVVLVTVAIVCLAFNHAVMQRNNSTRAQLQPVLESLKQLRDNKTISNTDYFSLKDRFTPLMYPTLHDPWLLRYISPIGSGCLILNSLLVLFNFRRKSRGSLSEVAHQETAKNG